MSERKNFIRNQEDFTCVHCGHKVIGNGYTNHCPACLWSLHVDNLPGDRANDCGGMMKPEEIEIAGDSYDIVHRCLRCGVIKRNKVVDNDSRDQIANIIKSQ